MHKEDKIKEELKEQTKITKKPEATEKHQRLPKHVRTCKINKEEASGNEKKRWITGYRSFKRNEEKAIVPNLES